MKERKQSHKSRHQDFGGYIREAGTARQKERLYGDGDAPCHHSSSFTWQELETCSHIPQVLPKGHQDIRSHIEGRIKWL